MLMTGHPIASKKKRERICMYRARTTRSTWPARRSSIRASASGFPSGGTGTW